MEKVYIFGHRNPDTDSVTAAITLSYLKNKLGMNTLPAVLSSINLESKYALAKFNTPELNLETTIAQPGYVRTLKQCLCISLEMLW